MSDLEDHMPGAYKDVHEAIQEIFHRMPFEQDVVVGGRKAKIVKLDKEPLNGHEEHDRWYFMFDIRFYTGSPDHLEFTVQHTGGGAVF